MPDLLVPGPLGPFAHLTRGDGFGGFGTAQRIAVGDPAHVLATLDADADGLLDIATTDTWGTVRLVRNTGCRPVAEDWVSLDGYAGRATPAAARAAAGAPMTRSGD